jgi:hypothetical protein
MNVIFIFIFITTFDISFIFTCDKNNTWSYILSNESCEGMETYLTWYYPIATCGELAFSTCIENEHWYQR